MARPSADERPAHAATGARGAGVSATFRLQADADLGRRNTFGVLARAPWLLEVDDNTVLAQALDLSFGLAYHGSAVTDGEVVVQARLPEQSLGPIRAEARSLNLSNSVAVGVFEALRQQDFPHLLDQGKMVNW